MSPPRHESICAVIVTRNPDDTLPDRARNLLQQVAAIVIVDNGSAPAAVDVLEDIQLRPDIHLILNRENDGIATALNQGVSRARELDFNWVLLFDQDSEPDDDMVRSLAAIFDHFPGRQNLAIIGSNYYRLDRERPEFTFSGQDPPWIERRSVITSGSLIPLDRHAEVGPFRDAFFIDHVDDEYSFRARRLGFDVIMSRDPLMKHAIGVRKEHRAFFRTVETSNHSPERRYYMGRNVMLVAREYLTSEPGWVVVKMWKIVKSLILITLFESNRMAKVRSLLRGVGDGLRGREGRRGYPA